jgi:hypothetical protein
MKKMPETVNLKATLEERTNTLRADLSFGMRAPHVDGQPTIIGVWRADLYEVESGARPRLLATFVTGDSEKESPADLLRQLADIYEAGELKVGS